MPHSPENSRYRSHHRRAFHGRWSRRGARNPTGKRNGNLAAAGSVPERRRHTRFGTPKRPVARGTPLWEACAGWVANRGWATRAGALNVLCQRERDRRVLVIHRST